ncbi:Beta-lactamase domain-containing protein [Thalictrum thalictroides]|uniref:Beta-lactamase domain-containing protein n=1 Tax=Thalictrum thalictroides TaxID=46969 RepID=A0A7J6WAA0_THATH|nr:Beta-lactamase domain-containing protein [Thalictrum thalictroides]
MNPSSQSDDLQGTVTNGAATNAQFFYDSPIQSDLEAKLKQLLIKLASANKIIGIQVCVYKDGKVVIDSVAGVLGENDPRPVQHDSLFPVFSTTKGIAAGMVHWLVDNGKLKLEDNIANIWPGFGVNKKDSIKVHHVLNHTSGLHNANSGSFSYESNWKACLNAVVTATPESEPGHLQLYHYASFGFLCGGIVEHASGKKFQEVLDEAIVCPLNIEGELYIGIPPGVESRLATLSADMEEVEKIKSANVNRPDLPSTFQPAEIARSFPIFAQIFSSLEVRQAIIPSANGHCTARALARYYGTLADGGIVPPPYPPSNDASQNNDGVKRIFHNPEIHDQFMGVGVYGDLTLPTGWFGLGFKRYQTKEGITGFGHSGMGGSVGYCDIKHNFAIGVTLNKMALGAVTGHVIHLVCSELNVPVPLDYAAYVEQAPDMKLN